MKWWYCLNQVFEIVCSLKIGDVKEHDSPSDSGDDLKGNDTMYRLVLFHLCIIKTQSIVILFLISILHTLQIDNVSKSSKHWYVFKILKLLNTHTKFIKKIIRNYFKFNTITKLQIKHWFSTVIFVLALWQFLRICGLFTLGKVIFLYLM